MTRVTSKPERLSAALVALADDLKDNPRDRSVELLTAQKLANVAYELRGMAR